MKNRALFALLALSLLSANAYAANSMNSPTNNTGAAMQTSPNNNLNAGQAFLEKNKTKPGVVTLPDGLQYKILTEGTGGRPQDGDEVTVNYTGKFINGSVFDSSYKDGTPTPISFPVNGVIPGWTEALKLMKEGSKWMLYIPANLAYGDHGAPPVIGPNETLVFEVQLLGIKR